MPMNSKLPSGCTCTILIASAAAIVDVLGVSTTKVVFPGCGSASLPLTRKAFTLVM
jgi:hypothetical protein